MTNKREILLLATAAGEALLKNGAEIFRVQETIVRILNAYHLENHSLFVISNGIFLTLNEEGEEHCFSLRHVPHTSLHLGRVTAINDLSRKIVQNPDIQKLGEYQRQMQECAELPRFPLWLQMVSCGAGSGGFCLLLGGSPYDAIVAFLCGLLLQLFQAVYSRVKKQSLFMHTLLGAGLVTALGTVGVTLFPAVLQLDYIIIGSIMSLVPGVALTTSIRDFFNGDYLSGSIHLTDVVLTGVCIAVGVGTVLRVWQLLGGVPA